MTDTLTLRRPDDWHVHLRDGDMLAAVAPYTARQMGRAIVMPNLPDPVTTVAAAEAYRARILKVTGDDFTPLMTAYLTDTISSEALKRGHAQGVFTAAKLYPAGATTNSDKGVTDVKNIHAVLEVMQDIGMPLLVHGEVTSPEIDIFDREAVFIHRVLQPILDDFPALKVVFEHITTAQAVDFVRSQGPRVGATITAHHLIINRSDIFRGGIHPHLYCLPVAKREQHRLALVEAATSGEESFFLGTDTAPHMSEAKESACGCAGIFTAYNAIELYAQVFDEQNALDKLEGFASLHGPKFYGLPVNEETVTLDRTEWSAPETIDNGVKVFKGGETLNWRMK